MSSVEERLDEILDDLLAGIEREQRRQRRRGDLAAWAGALVAIGLYTGLLALTWRAAFG